MPRHTGQTGNTVRPRQAVRVASPAEDVYARIVDPRRRTEWLPELESTSGAPDDRPLREGDSFTGYAALLGHRFVGHSEVTTATADDERLRLEEHVVIGARFRTAWTVTPDPTNDHACHVVHELDVEFPEGPFGRIERWVLARYLDRLQRAGLQRLARTTTAGGSGRRRP